MPAIRLILVLLAGAGFTASGLAGDANRLTWLDENNPYYPSRAFPRLITPQWVGEPGVEAVVVLAIDDMRDPPRYEAFVRPILTRLKQIDGLAPLSIMTCKIDPQSPQLATWLAEGLSLEIHTVDHPCPLLQGGDLAAAKSTYDRCVDLIGQVPGNRPVAFRMPCCDSLNTVSPRFYREIFNGTTPSGRFLEIDSSVFNYFTSNDPALPRELVIDADGREKFGKYIPTGLVKNGMTFNSFVNTIFDYPYPYVIDHLCWEFPCVAPSDWSAQHLHKPNNPDTLRDLKAALDLTVLRQGVFNLVFHPHGWIKNSQIVELIDHAIVTHGKKVKFLTFREALDRIHRNLLAETPLRDERGGDNGVRVLDLNHDGYMDVVVANRERAATRVWQPATQAWATSDFPAAASRAPAPRIVFGVFHDDRPTCFAVRNGAPAAWQFDGTQWQPDADTARLLERAGVTEGAGVCCRDLDRDGVCELLIQSTSSGDAPAPVRIYRKAASTNDWHELDWKLPVVGQAFAPQGGLHGIRFLDFDDDGFDDLLVSNAGHYSIDLFDTIQTGFSRPVLSGVRGEKPLAEEIPPLVRSDGSDNGFFTHSRHLWWQNEDTAKNLDLVERRALTAYVQNVAARPLAPAAGLNSLHARPGFVIELAAAEPLTQDPVAFAWGPDGKFWIAEMADYPLGVPAPAGSGETRLVPGGRIRFLEDQDGDGQYDKSTLFLDKVPFPNGVCPWGKGVLVTAAPDIFYAEDTDGDGRADRQETLYSGFAEGNQQHRVNGLVWGLDNWLHCANGDSGGAVLSVKTNERHEIRGRDLRIRPVDGALDPEAGQSQFGRAQDDWGNWFGCNNSNPMYQFVIEDRYLRRNPHVPLPDPKINVSETPGAAPVFPLSPTRARFNDRHTANRFTSACSVIIYRDELFGPHFAGNSFVSEPVHNLVHREQLTASGATFNSRRAADELAAEFLASTDNWFRPTMIRTGPDGALWIADMYRETIEHPQWIPADWQKRLDLRAGCNQGRIYRVFPVGRPPRPIPRLDHLDAAGLVAALDSPSGWQRDMAQQLLVERQDPAAVPHLEKLARTSRRALARLHALCTLDGLHRLRLPMLLTALHDSHAGVRRHAVRLCEQLHPLPAELAAPLFRLAGDADPQLRLQLACTLGEIDDPRTGRVLGELLDRAQNDRFHYAAVMSSVNAANIEEFLLAMLKQRDSGAPNLNLIEHLLALASALGNKTALARLLDEVAAPAAGQFETWQYQALAGLFDSLDRRNSPLPVPKTVDNPALRAALERVAVLTTAARLTARDDSAPAARRAAALGCLGRDLDGRNADLQILGDCLAPRQATEIREAALNTLGRIRDRKCVDVILAAWGSLSPAARTVALDLLLSRADGRERLLDAIDQKQVEPAAFDAARRRRLLEQAAPDARARVARLLAANLNSNRTQVLEAFRPALNLPGDVAAGGRHFARLCAQCHRLANAGHDVGPDLASLGDKSPEGLLVAVLDPNRAVEARYINYTAVTRSGITYTGLLAAESGGSITLKGPEAKEFVVPRSDLEELLGSSKSTMPEGLEKDLHPQDLADLFAYVRANIPQQKPKSFAGNKPELVAPDKSGVLSLTPTNCEIYGGSLTLEEKYRNLGLWTSVDDHALWNIEIPRAQKYAVWLEWACDDHSAGNSFTLQTAAQSLTTLVASTGSWDAYKKTRIGNIELAAGRQRFVMRPAGVIQNALLDLKGLTLIPIP